VDFAADVIEVHREPRGAGYASSERAGRGASVAPAAFPDLVLRADDILLEP
jgi:hypothetical protein